MTMDELLRSEVFLLALENHYYEEWLRRIDDEIPGEHYTFSPEFLRKMEELLGHRADE